MSGSGLHPSACCWIMWFLVFQLSPAHLTGGTTLLQHMISRLDEVSPENCSQVTTVAMADRRPSAEQKENPYVLGEMIIVE